MFAVASVMAASNSARDWNLLLSGALDGSAPSERRASSSLSIALSRAAWAEDAPVKSRRAAASATSFSARRMPSLSSSIVGKSSRFLMSASSFDWRGAHSVKAFLETASSRETCTSEILDSNTVRVSGRFDSNASFRGALNGEGTYQQTEVSLKKRVRTTRDKG